jgi:hypothetical protein
MQHTYVLEIKSGHPFSFYYFYYFILFFPFPLQILTLINANTITDASTTSSQVIEKSIEYEEIIAES